MLCNRCCRPLRIQQLMWALRPVPTSKRSPLPHHETKLHARNAGLSIVCRKWNGIGARIVSSGLVERVHAWVARKHTTASWRHNVFRSALEIFHSLCPWSSWLNTGNSAYNWPCCAICQYYSKCQYYLIIMLIFNINKCHTYLIVPG